MEYSQKTMRRLEQARELYKQAEREGRDLTPEEQHEVEAAIDASSREKSMTAFEAAIGGNGSAEVPGNGAVPEGAHLGRDPGLAFIESAGYKAIADPGARSQRWSSGAVDVGQLAHARMPLAMKGTLLEGAGAPGAGTGGGLIPVPQVLPGVVTTLFQPLNVADLFAQATTSTSTVRYVVEGTATSGAAGVAEGAAKPESTLGLDTDDEQVKKIATSIVTSDELLEDGPATQQFVSGRLTLFVKLEEERQLLRGGGTNELLGVFGRSGLNTYPRGTVDNNAVAIFKAMNGTRGSSFLEPDAVIMHPTNWQTTRLLTDTAGQFFGGGPFLGAYGGPQGPIGASGQVTGPVDMLWNKPVVLSTIVGAGTALVGSFGAGAQIVRRGGVSVEATNSHSDHFTRNLVAMRAEERLALCVFRPASFVQVTGLN